MYDGQGWWEAVIKVGVTQRANIETNERTRESFSQTGCGADRAWDRTRMGADSGRPMFHPALEIEAAATVAGGTGMHVAGCAGSDEVYLMGLLLTTDPWPFVEPQDWISPSLPVVTLGRCMKAGIWCRQQKSHRLYSSLALACLASLAFPCLSAVWECTESKEGRWSWLNCDLL